MDWTRSGPRLNVWAIGTVGSLRQLLMAPEEGDWRLKDGGITVSSKYWGIVRMARALVAFPFVVVFLAWVASQFDYSLDASISNLLRIFCGTSGATAASGIFVVLSSLQRLRRQSGGSDSMWVEDELKLFIKHVLLPRRWTGVA